MYVAAVAALMKYYCVTFIFVVMMKMNVANTTLHQYNVCVRCADICIGYLVINQWG